MTGAETVIHAFQGGADGANPVAGLTRFGGLLVGTTEGGGTSGHGTVFTVNLATGSESVVYSFKGTNIDGAVPEGTLIDAGGILYGTTMAGGPLGLGSVFALAP